MDYHYGVRRKALAHGERVLRRLKQDIFPWLGNGADGYYLPTLVRMIIAADGKTWVMCLRTY